MKVHLEVNPKNNQTYWFSDDRRFYGVIVEPFELEFHGEPETREAFPAGALLSVPKYSPGNIPTLNKHSPVIVKAPSVEALVPMLEEWVDKNAGKNLWDLRRP